MLSILPITLPVFALIFAGWLVRRMGVLGAQATSELNRFVVTLALPALLFDVVAKADWHELWQPGFVGAFTLATGLVFALTIGLRLAARQPLADASIDGLNAAYANTGFIGVPLVLVALGQPAMPFVMIATIITVCLLFAAAIILIEVGLQKEGHPAHIVLGVLRSLAVNPLLFAPVLALLFPLSGTAMPAPVDSFLTLLGGAAAPCALVALGLFLGEKREAGDAGASGIGTAAWLIGFKMLLHPLLMWVFAKLVFGLPSASVRAAVLLATLPTGTGSFMLAQSYGREAATTGRVVLVTTLIAIVSASAWLAVSA
jgi:malonate transporter and related proteins